MAAQHWGTRSDLIAALRSYTQADEDGVVVKVSRQACDEAADRLAALEAELAKVREVLRDLLHYVGDGSALERDELPRHRNHRVNVDIANTNVEYNEQMRNALNAAIDAARKEGK